MNSVKPPKQIDEIIKSLGFIPIKGDYDYCMSWGRGDVKRMHPDKNGTMKEVTIKNADITPTIDQIIDKLDELHSALKDENINITCTTY